MSDVFIPGIRSRLNTDQLVEDIMRLERIPQERVERNIENLQAQRGHWQEVGRRITALRDSSRALFGFQNPFTERAAFSSNPGAISVSATRQAVQQSASFTVLQTATADRFISAPQDENMQIEAGTFVVAIGDEEVSLDFAGGTIRDFSEALNRSGQENLNARLVSVQPRTVSLVLDSLITGAENRMTFAGDAAPLMVQIGMMEQIGNIHREIDINESNVQVNGTRGQDVNISPYGTLEVPALASVSIGAGEAINTTQPLVLRLETFARDVVEVAEEAVEAPQAPAVTPVAPGSVTFGGISIVNAPSTAPFPRVQAPAAVADAEPERIDNMAVLSLTFSDGSREELPALSESEGFQAMQFNLTDIARGRTLAAVNIENTNTHREVLVQNISIFNTEDVQTSFMPANPISLAGDAVLAMEGIEMSRPSNDINDIIPGVTLSLRAATPEPVQVSVDSDNAAILDAIIMFVGNYNRLMAELNVLTNADTSLVDELIFLTPDEAAEMRERSGAFVGDSTLNSLRSNLQRITSSPFPTSDGGVMMLAQIGISTNVRPQGAFIDVTRLRGYLEIDERVLTEALANNPTAVRELFGSNTEGGIITNNGVAFNIDNVAQPFVEVGGIISLRTNTIDSRITQDQRSVENLERQLVAREAQLRIQYSQMEAAFSRMEQMTNSFENFSQQMRNNNR